MASGMSVAGHYVHVPRDVATQNCLSCVPQTTATALGEPLYVQLSRPSPPILQISILRPKGTAIC